MFIEIKMLTQIAILHNYGIFNYFFSWKCKYNKKVCDIMKNSLHFTQFYDNIYIVQAN